MVAFNVLNNPVEILGADTTSALVARRRLQRASAGFPACRESRHDTDTQGGERKQGLSGEIKLFP